MQLITYNLNKYRQDLFFSILSILTCKYKIILALFKLLHVKKKKNRHKYVKFILLNML